ncbi:MAG: hypothetical protein PWP27_2181 [Clostridiales bacterium]|jgi:hypothetical protein|nr:hypothetical protein [Clostridiales bacterium]
MFPDYSPMCPGAYDYGYGLPYSHQVHHKQLVETIQECEAICEHMTTLLKRRPDMQARIRQLQLLRDCADICGLTAKYVARNSAFAKPMADFCANICEVCGRECARFPDSESQHCAQICFNCARECRAFAMT